MGGKNKKINAHCNKCHGEKKHLVLHSEKQQWEDDDYGPYIYGGEAFEIIRCCGCADIKLRHSAWSSDYVNIDGSLAINVSYYPTVVSRRPPDWLHLLNDPMLPEDHQYIGLLLQEIYVALQNNLRQLATMGARALLEQVMVSKVGDNGSFSKNLVVLQNKGYLSEHQKKIIEPILEAGHAAMHRKYHPEDEDVNTVIEITERLVESLYIHADKASRLSDRVPRRKK